MSLMFIALLCSYTLVGVLSFACFWLADIADRARRNRPAPIVLEPLPRCIARPAVLRRRR